jgi:hypothetical protein
MTMQQRNSQQPGRRQNMLARITKLIGYTKAPRATYIMRHPIKGVQAWRAARRPVNRAAITGAGAAVLALPMGLWFLRRRGQQQHTSAQHQI